MNKTAKYILIGVGSFIGLFLIILLLRFLIRGIPFADGIRNWYTWLLAVSGGIGTAYSIWKKDQEKK